MQGAWGGQPMGGGPMEAGPMQGGGAMMGGAMMGGAAMGGGAMMNKGFGSDPAYPPGAMGGPSNPPPFGAFNDPPPAYDGPPKKKAW